MARVFIRTAAAVAAALQFVVIGLCLPVEAGLSDVAVSQCEPSFGISGTETHLLGGFTNVDCGSEIVQKLAAAADLEPAEVYAVTSQLVAGRKYVLFVEVSGSCYRVPVWSKLDQTVSVLSDEICRDQDHCSAVPVKRCEN
nr:cystatin [Dermanyssus gallinae]